MCELRLEYETMTETNYCVIFSRTAVPLSTSPNFSRRFRDSRHQGFTLDSHSNQIRGKNMRKRRTSDVIYPFYPAPSYRSTAPLSSLFLDFSTLFFENKSKRLTNLQRIFLNSAAISFHLFVLVECESSIFYFLL